MQVITVTYVALLPPSLDCELLEGTVCISVPSITALLAHCLAHAKRPVRGDGGTGTGVVMMVVVMAVATVGVSVMVGGVILAVNFFSKSTHLELFS